MSHEEAVANLKSALSDYQLPNGLVAVKGVDVEGRANKQLLKAYLAPLLKGSQTPESLAHSIRKVQCDLYNLGVYKDVNLSLSPEGVVKIALPPVNKFVARVGTNVGQNEGTGYIKGMVRNAFGFGEVIGFDASEGTRTTSAHNFTVSVPVPHEKLVGVNAESVLYSSERLYEWASSSARFRGGSLSLQKANKYAFGIYADMRSLATKTASFSQAMSRELGNSFKWSLFFNYKKTFGSFTDGDFNNNGSQIYSQTELALPTTTYPFFKSFLSQKTAFPVYKSATASVNSKFGFLIPFNYTTSENNERARSNLIDRFNLGGPLDLRGFKLNHVGPHDKGDALGGELLAAAGLSVFSPIRGLNENLRAHGFFNIGALSPLYNTKLPYPSSSFGLGLVFANPTMRVELSFALPLVARVDEAVQKGLVFGIGLDFL